MQNCKLGKQMSLTQMLTGAVYSHCESRGKPVLQTGRGPNDKSIWVPDI